MRETIAFICTFAMTFALTRWLIPRLTRLVTKSGLVRANYRGAVIPVGLGLVFFCGVMPGSLAFFAFQGSDNSAKLFMWLWGLGAMGLAGFLDDCLGDRLVSGLKGHWSALLRKGELTTGVVKAAVGLMVGLGGALVEPAGFNGNLDRFLLHLLVIVLNINLLNLLDLRPGRAGKFFLVASLLLVVGAGLPLAQPGMFLHLLLIASVLAYLGADLQGRVMMGDSGSNILGVGLGLASAWLLPDNVLLLQALGLVIVHIFAEKYSISRLVEKVTFLRFLDGLGRSKS